MLATETPQTTNPQPSDAPPGARGERCAGSAGRTKRHWRFQVLYTTLIAKYVQNIAPDPGGAAANKAAAGRSGAFSCASQSGGIWLPKCRDGIPGSGGRADTDPAGRRQPHFPSRLLAAPIRL